MFTNTWYNYSMDRNADGTFTKKGAKKFGFQKGNTYGEATGGEKHYAWKGGVKLYPSHHTTYRAIKIGKKYIFEHRYLMEQHIGRKLRSTEAVHHKDHNGLNNAIENLEIVNWHNHKQKHKGSYFYGKDFQCLCGRTKHFAKGMCSRCYNREYARKKYGYKRRYVTYG